MTSQRKRRGQVVSAFARVLETDRRGNIQYVVDETTPIWQGKGWIFPERSQRAEINGQQEITVYNLGIADDPQIHSEKVGLWSYVLWNGAIWDVVRPPMWNPGVKRHTSHWLVEIRRRPGELIP